MESWVAIVAVSLALAWGAAVVLRPSLALDPRCLLLLNTLSAFLCSLWACEDPCLDSSAPFPPYPTITRRAATCLFLALMIPVYLGLAAGQLARLRPASAPGRPSIA